MFMEIKPRLQLGRIKSNKLNRINIILEPDRKASSVFRSVDKHRGWTRGKALHYVAMRDWIS